MTESSSSSLRSADEPAVGAGCVGEALRRAEPVLAGAAASTSARWLTRAPARLDVCGGIAEYTGGPSIGVPCAGGVFTTVQLRSDNKIAIHGTDRMDGGGAANVFDLPRLAGQPADELAGQLPESVWVRAAVGAVHAIHATGKADGTQSGVTIVLDCDQPFSIDTGMSASVAVSIVMALCEAWGLKFEPAECAQLTARAQNGVLGFPCGVGPGLCVMHARKRHLTHICCRDNDLRCHVEIPAGTTVIGIDCGAKHADANRKYALARSAAFMGRLLIERIFASRNGGRDAWKGTLGEISIGEYLEKLRDRLPTKMRGADFLDRYGDTADALTSIDPSTVYRIRSRTEHHIYESDRAARFIDGLSTAAGADGRSAVIEAGELMYASHWSYGQRCGLGSVETDRLVTLIRRRGVDAGLYGARVSGQGSGGVVVVLMDDTPAARTAVSEIIREYEQVAGKTAALLEGSSDGALQFGVHRA